MGVTPCKWGHTFATQLPQNWLNVNMICLEGIVNPSFSDVDLQQMFRETKAGAIDDQ